MKTISQIADITSVSVRTLQYYDEINLLTPSAVTEAGYRLYNDEALEKIQQILFFKELGFKLKEIKEILQKPDYDKLAAYTQQKKLLCLKRDRLNKLIKLLDKLEKGEICMSFNEFDLTEYIEALEQFKADKAEEITKYWGSIDNFNLFIQKVKEDESNVAQMAIKQYGSVQKYAEAMKYNFEHFSEIMEKCNEMRENVDELINRSDALYYKLTSDIMKEVSSDEIQSIVHEIIEFSQATTMGTDMGEGFWPMVIESYSHDNVKAITDTKYGSGASTYIAKALQYYFQNNPRNSE